MANGTDNPPVQAPPQAGSGQIEVWSPPDPKTGAPKRGTIPASEVTLAMSQGYKPASAYVEAIHPRTGQTGVVPREEWNDASKQGFILSPGEQQRVQARQAMGALPGLEQLRGGPGAFSPFTREGQTAGQALNPDAPLQTGGTQPLSPPVRGLYPEQAQSLGKTGALLGGAGAGGELIAPLAEGAEAVGGASKLLRWLIPAVGRASGTATGAAGAELATGASPQQALATGSQFGATELGGEALVGGTIGLLRGGVRGMWNRLSGYSSALEEAKQANVSAYRLAEQKAGEAIEQARGANISRYSAAEQKAGEAIEQGKRANLSRYLAGEQTASEAQTQAEKEFLDLSNTRPQGAAGEWARTNEAIGAPPRAIKIGRGAGDLEGAKSIAGRGLANEGFTPERLLDMAPNDQARLVGDSWNRAGQAITAATDQATQNGAKVNLLQNATDIFKRIPNPIVRDQAAAMFVQVARENGIADIFNATPTEALKFRQAIPARFTAAADLASVPGVGQQLRRAVSSSLHDAVPGLDQLDTHYGDLTSAVNAIQKQVQKYLAGSWKKPVLTMAKAAEAVPGMPVSSPYTPLPGRPTSAAYTPLPGMPASSPYTPLPRPGPFDVRLASRLVQGAGGAALTEEALRKGLTAIRQRKRGQ